MSIFADKFFFLNFFKTENFNLPPVGSTQRHQLTVLSHAKCDNICNFLKPFLCLTLKLALPQLVVALLFVRHDVQVYFIPCLPDIHQTLKKQMQTVMQTD